MKIHGTITCYDTPDLCTTLTSAGQSADIACFDTTDFFDAQAFVIGQTFSLPGGSSFIQDTLLDSSHGLNLYLMNPMLRGWTQNIDGTYIDSTYYEPRPYNPIEINYGIYYTPDNTRWTLQGYRFREPMNPQVGHYYANMEVPDQIGNYKIQWLYRKDSSSYTTAVDQPFNVTLWGNNSTSYWDGTAWVNLFIEVLPQSQSRLPGETANFTLHLTGTVPAPLTYTWRKYGTDMTDGSTGSGSVVSGATTSALTITNVSMADYASYDCIVSYIAQSTLAWLFIDPP